jgi:thiamine biosynthesis protein ThiS
MKITLNGQPRDLPANTSIQDLLALLQMDVARVAVEHNRAILAKDRFAATRLAEGDTVEVVQFVGGG